MILGLWALSSVVATAFAIYIIKEQSGSEFSVLDLLTEKENTVLMFISIVLPAFMFMGVAGAAMFQVIRNHRQRKVRTIIRTWENASVNYSEIKVKAGDKGYSEVIHLLREHTDKLSDKELELLASITKEEFEVDKILLDAVLDEIVERKLLRE